jgi:predicted transcriptional regulator
MTLKRRSQIEIISSILSLCSQKPICTGELQSLAKLNGRETKSYLSFLVNAKFLKLRKHKNKKIYSTTIKGKKLLALCSTVKEILA